MSSGESFWSEEMFLIHGLEPDGVPPLEQVMQIIHSQDRARVADIFNAQRASTK